MYVVHVHVCSTCTCILCINVPVTSGCTCTSITATLCFDKDNNCLISFHSYDTIALQFYSLTSLRCLQ